MVMILHSGQTGVERGAHRAAIAARLPVAGVMPLDRRDELGRIPQDIAELLVPCHERGPRPAVRATIGLAHGVLVVVPDAAAPEKLPAMTAVLQAVRSARVPSLTCDPRTNLDDVARWARNLLAAGESKILVTGPRGTRWPEGEAVARRVVSAIALGL